MISEVQENITLETLLSKIQNLEKEKYLLIDRIREIDLMNNTLQEKLDAEEEAEKRDHALIYKSYGGEEENEVDDNEQEETFTRKEESMSPLTSLSLDSTKLKLECFCKSFLMSFLIFFLVMLCTEKEFGVINITAKATNSDHFFLAIVIGRLLLYVSSFFIIGKSIQDIRNILFYALAGLSWILICILERVLFPILTGASSNSPSASDKTLIFLVLFISNVISNTVSSTFWYYSMLVFRPSLLNSEFQENGSRNFKAIFFRSLKVEGVLASFIFFLFFIILGVGSFSNLPNLDQNMEIFLFGYCFPLLKAFVSSVSYGICVYFSELKGWSVEYTAKMTSAFSCAGVIATTLSQLFIVFRNANDSSYFLSQYLPHEIIKKLSWLTFHPFYLKTKMQVVDILSSSFCRLVKKRDKVDPAGMNKNSRKRRLTAVVMSNIGATAGEIVGRQLGEDLCMILITIWMLPISQEYLFAQSYPLSSSSLPFPSYESVGVMIIGTAYGTETILTILCFVILQRVGIPLMANRQALEFHVMSWGMYTFAISSMMLMLAATFIY